MPDGIAARCPLTGFRKVTFPYLPRRNPLMTSGPPVMSVKVPPVCPKLLMPNAWVSLSKLGGGPTVKMSTNLPSCQTNPRAVRISPPTYPTTWRKSLMPSANVALGPEPFAKWKVTRRESWALANSAKNRSNPNAIDLSVDIAHPPHGWNWEARIRRRIECCPTNGNC